MHPQKLRLGETIKVSRVPGATRGGFWAGQPIKVKDWPRPRQSYRLPDAYYNANAG